VIDITNKEITMFPSTRFDESPLGKMTEGKTFDKSIGEYDKLLDSYIDKPGKTDDNGKEYSKNGELLPNTEYTLNGNIYQTDEDGRIFICVYKPQKMPENISDIDSQISVGGEDRKPGDQSRHIVGRDIGGDEGLGNLIPMDARISQSDYKRMENDIKQALEEGKDVKTGTALFYNIDSKRPDIIETTIKIDGKITEYYFDNNVDGSLVDGSFMGDISFYCSESDIKKVQNVLDETGGIISSIKAECNVDGFFEKTTVTITYTDENGMNYRNVVVNGGDTLISKPFIDENGPNK